MKLFKNIIIGVLVIGVAVVVTFILRRNFFSFDKKLTKEQKTIIEKYISDKNNSNLEESMTFTSAYYFGDRYNDDILTVYLWVMYKEYDTSGNQFEPYGEFSIPYVIIVDTKGEKFEILEHKIPKDGNEYKKSIASLFPITIRSQVLRFISSNEYKKLLEEHYEMIEIYEEYSKESE